MAVMGLSVDAGKSTCLLVGLMGEMVVTGALWS